MASRKGKTIAGVFEAIRVLNSRYFDIAEFEAAALSSNTGIDYFVKHLWFRAQDGINTINNLQTTVDTLGATPAISRQALRDYAEAQYGATYNILAETATLRTLLEALKTAVEADLGGLDAQGFVQGQVIKLDTSPPFWRQLTPAEMTNSIAALANITAHISD